MSDFSADLSDVYEQHTTQIQQLIQVQGVPKNVPIFQPILNKQGYFVGTQGIMDPD